MSNSALQHHKPFSVRRIVFLEDALRDLCCFVADVPTVGVSIGGAYVIMSIIAVMEVMKIFMVSVERKISKSHVHNTDVLRRIDVYDLLIYAMNVSMQRDFLVCLQF